MAGVSIHVVDVSRGVVAAGMQVELHAIGVGGKLELLAKGATDATGLLNRPELSKPFVPGGYVAVFHVWIFTARRASPCPPCRSSTSSASISASPSRRSTIICRSNARPGATPASAASLEGAGKNKRRPARGRRDPQGAEMPPLS